MTTKKVPKNENKPKPAIQINRSRGGGKKRPDLFARLRNTEHPLDNLIPAGDDLETQNNILGNPNETLLETQNNILGNPTISDLETQNNTFGNPNKALLETQNLEFGNPTGNNLETQSKIIGDPKIPDLGTIAPKDEIRAPKAESDSGTIKPKEKNLGTQNSKTTEAYRKYEKARSTASLHIRADETIVKRAQHFIVENKKDIPTMREFFELAATLLMDEFGNPKNSNLGANTPYDDGRLKMMFKTKPFIINLYLRYNSVFNELSTAGGKKWAARWSPRDDEAAVRYNDIPPAILELGILQTQLQKGFGTSRIQTFKYYTDEIEKVLVSGVSDEMLVTILTYHRQLWTNQTGREVDLGFLDMEKMPNENKL